MGNSTGNSMNEKEPKSKLPLIIVIAVAVIVILAVSVYALTGFGNSDKTGTKGKGSEKGVELTLEEKLQQAFDKTNEAQANLKAQFPSLDKFGDAAAEQFVTISSETLAGSSLDLTLLTDMKEKQEKFILKADVNASGIALLGNELYFGRDLWALKLPVLGAEADYITINPATLVEDWNNSDLGLTAPLEADAQESIDQLWDTVESDQPATSVLSAEAEKLIEDLDKEINNGVALKLGASEEITLNEVAVKCDTYIYTVPAKNVDSAVKMFLSNYRSAFDDLITQSLENNSLYDKSEIEDMYSEIDALLGDMDIKKDMVIKYYVDKEGYVRKISMDDFEIVSKESPLSKPAFFRFDYVLSGEKNPHSNYAINIALGEKDDEVLISIAGENNNTAKLVDEKMSFVFDYTGTKLTFDYGMYWDKADTNDLNVSLDLKMDGEKIKLGVTGKLVEDKDEVRIDNGKVLVTYNGVTVPIDFHYYIKSVGSSEVAIDASSSMSFFELPLKELASTIQQYMDYYMY